MRIRRYLLLTAFASIAAPPTATAATVQPFDPHATCTRTGDVTATIRFEGFTEQQKPISGIVSVDGGRIPIRIDRFTFPGPTGTLTVTFPKAVTDDDYHSVFGDFTWPQQATTDQGSYGSFVGSCITPPTAGQPPITIAPPSAREARREVRKRLKRPKRWDLSIVVYGHTATVVRADKPSGAVWFFTVSRNANGTFTTVRRRHLLIPF